MCNTTHTKERDTSCTPISLPALTGMPFPKVLHRSETDCQVIQSFQSSRNNLVSLKYQGEFDHLKCLYRSKQGPHSLSRGKKSIFARQIAAQRLKEGSASVCTPETVQMCNSSMETDQCRAADERELACLNVSSVFVKLSLYFISTALILLSNCCLRTKVGVWTGACGP